MSDFVPINVVRERLNTIHGESFAYPFLDTEYKAMSSQVTVTCPIHGNIKKTLAGLISGKSGCPHCAPLRRRISRMYNKNKAREEMNRFYAFIKERGLASTSPLHCQNRPIIRIDYNLILRQYLRLRVHDGIGDYLS